MYNFSLKIKKVSHDFLIVFFLGPTTTPGTDDISSEFVSNLINTFKRSENVFENHKILRTI